jgi:glycosyltransferase involved in cell wall biosynthesis
MPALESAHAENLVRAMGLVIRPSRLMFVSTDLNSGGGAESMLARLVTARPPLADDILVVSLTSGGFFAQKMREAGIKVVELDFKRASGILPGLFKLVKLIAQAKPEIVQGWMYHGDLAALIALTISGRRKMTRLIWSIRCSALDLSRYGTVISLVIRACTLLSGRPDLITANSIAGMKSHLAMGYCPRASAILGNGIDMDAFKPDRNARLSVRRELHIGVDTIVLAHVARVDPMKDHDSFLRAMEELPDICALLIGPHTEALPSAPNIVRLGLRNDVAQLLSAADFIVSSSAFGEGFSNAIAEGMACGLPAIATDVGDAREIVGDTGLIVRPGDALAFAAAVRTLAAEPIATRRLRAQRARERIATLFSLELAVDNFRAVYNGTVQRDS